METTTQPITLEVIIFKHQLPAFMQLITETHISYFSAEQKTTLPDGSIIFTISFSNPTDIYLFGVAWQAIIHLEDFVLDLKFADPDTKHIDTLLKMMEVDGAIAAIQKHPVDGKGNVLYQIGFHNIRGVYNFAFAIGGVVAEIIETS